MVIAGGLTLFGLVALYAGGTWLVKGAARLASSFGVSSLVIGLTVVAWSTSAPELVVSISAALQGTSDIALGNVLGSNVSNIGLILGGTGLITLIPVSRQLVKRELLLLLITAGLAYLLAADGTLSQVDGGLLVLGFAVFSWVIYHVVKREQRALAREFEAFAEEEDFAEKGEEQVNRWLETGRVLLGLALLIFGANLTVDGATTIARGFGISDLVIGVTLVALGTSLPELATSFIAAFQNHADIAVGNVIGSNIANILAILGITALTQPIPVASSILFIEFPVMLGFSLMLLLFSLDQWIKRWEAVILLLGYLGFVGSLFLR